MEPDMAEQGVFATEAHRTEGARIGPYGGVREDVALLVFFAIEGFGTRRKEEEWHLFLHVAAARWQILAGLSALVALSGDTTFRRI